MDDPIPDIEPDMQPTEEPKALVSSPNQFLSYSLLMVLLLVYYRLGWKAVEFILIDKVTVFKDYSMLVFGLWIIPILGLLSSIVYPTLGGTSAWTISVAVIAAVPIGLSIAHVLWFGLPVSQTVPVV
jgi:hypothetical protein